MEPNAFTLAILDFLAMNPHLAVLITIMTICRAVFKPGCALIQTYVDSTPWESDNQKWTAVQQNKIFKAVAFIMDFLFSLKLPKPTPKP